MVDPLSTNLTIWEVFRNDRGIGTLQDYPSTIPPAKIGSGGFVYNDIGVSCSMKPAEMDSTLWSDAWAQDLGNIYSCFSGPGGE